MTMLDSKKKSASEALVNSLGGFPVGYGLGIIILPISTGWIQEDPYMANIAITGAYAITSFVRSYFLRRVFEKYGIDDNFINSVHFLLHSIFSIFLKYLCLELPNIFEKYTY